VFAHRWGRHAGLPLHKPQAGEFLTAPKKALARGKPKAKLQGPPSFGTFLGVKKSTLKNKNAFKIYDLI